MLKMSFSCKHHRYLVFIANLDRLFIIYGTARLYYGKYSVLSVRTPYILPDTDTVDVTLNKGANPVLVKVCRDGGHNWGFAIRITDTQGKVIKGLRLSLDRRK